MATSIRSNKTDKADTQKKKQIKLYRFIKFSNQFTKTFITGTMILLLPYISGSQESIPDLLTKYNSQEHDTIRIDALLDLGMVYEKNNNPDSAKLYYKEAEKYSLQSLTNTDQKREEIEELQLLSCRSQRYLALLYRNTGNYNESIELFKKVIQRYEGLLETIRKSRIDYAKSELSKTYNNLGTAYLSIGNYLASIENHNKSHELKLQIGDIKGAGISLVNIGNVHFYQGNLDEANKSYFEALDVLQTTNEYKEISTTQTSIGNVYFQQGNYEEALKYYLESLKIEEEHNNKSGLSRSYISVGNVHYQLGNMNQSLYYYKQAYIMKKEIGDNKGEAGCLNNIGNIYRFQRDFHKAAETYLEAQKIYEKLNDSRGLTETYTNLGLAFFEQSLNSEAEEYFNKALLLAENNQNQSMVSNILANLAGLYNKQKKYDLAIKTALKSIDISKELGIIKEIRNAYNHLSLSYEKKGDYKQALEKYKSYKEFNDSLMNSEKHEQITRMEAIYQSEKKQSQIELFIKEKELQDITITRQKIILLIIAVSLVIVSILSFVLFRFYQHKKKIANELLEKNRLITDQKIQITNGIRYASRIQNAILPSLDMVKQLLPEHFILFMPKDIVSGDFYWITQRNNKVIVAVADCTGHGVSGAFMSMLGISFLIQIVTIENTTESDKILSRLKNYFNSALYPEGIKTEQKDGMEIAIAIIDPEDMVAEYSGANSPLLMVRNGEIIEYEPNKTAIGTFKNDNGAFKRHIIELKKNDALYFFSDGFISQFGGANGQMFMSKPFRQLLINIHDKPAEEQKQILYKTHLEWRGNNEQIDDILVLGIKI